MAVTLLPRWKSVLGAVAVTGVALLGAAPPALAQDGGGGPDPTSAPVQERVSAEVLPGVVYLKTDIHTYMRNTGTGQLVGPIDFSASCTGFVVNQNGYIGTAGHCVNDDDIRESIAQEMGAYLGQQYNQDPAKMTQYIIANYKLEGEAAGSPADKKVSVVQAGQGTNQTPLQAQIVDSRSNAQGDVALLKVNATDMPTIEVAPPGPVNTGTPIMTIGYPAARDKNFDPTLAPTYKEGSVSSQQNRNGVPFMEITADMGHGMSGGPTVNQQGQVVGVNSMGTGDELGSFNFVAPSSTLLEMMSRNGVRPEAGPADIAYRAGLDDYYQGYYSDAEEKFQKVLDQSPENKSAQDFKAKAARAHDQFGDKGLGTMEWSLIGGGAFLVLAAGGVVILLARRTGKGGQAPAQVAGAPSPQPLAPQQAQAPQQAPQQAPGTAAPFGLPVGYQVPVPGMPAPQVPHRPQVAPQPRPSGGPSSGGPSFGSAPFGAAREVETGPRSPAVGFPSPVATPSAPASAEATEKLRPASVGVASPAHPAPGFCPKCGAARAAGSRFCGTCGADMS